MYITKDRSKAPDIDIDQVIEYDLACPFTVIAKKCPSSLQKIKIELV